jgi:phenylpropionate dioxygenase-like ring-hydroxylating dioxygenase large terminal subunit
LKIIDTMMRTGWMVAMCKCGKRRAVNMKQFERGENTACIACEKLRQMQSFDSQYRHRLSALSLSRRNSLLLNEIEITTKPTITTADVVIRVTTQ